METPVRPQVTALRVGPLSLPPHSDIESETWIIGLIGVL